MATGYTGIDIGSSSLKIAVCSGGRASKLATEVMPIGIMNEGRIVSFDALADFIKETVKAHGGVPKNACVNLSSSESLTRRLSMPLMTDKEVTLNLPYEFRDFIDQGKDNYYYDYKVLGPVQGQDGSLEGMDVLACAASKALISDLDRMCNRAGLRLKVALPFSASLQDLVESGPAANTDCCVIDFGHRATRLVFFAKGKFDVVRTIEIGGAEIDRAIADALDVDLRLAGEYKHVNYQGCLENSEVRAVFERISIEVTRALTFYNFNNPELDLQRAYCVGGGSQLVELVDLIDREASIQLLPAAALLGGSSEAPGDLATCAAAIASTVKAE